jgi:pimeloyl-ACP methyl ester carboxylesterase
MELVCLPGTLCDGRVFAPLLAQLGRGALCPDLAGSDTVAALAGHLLPGLPARCILAGFSFGGIVAFELLRRAPERVTGLVLLSTNARADTPEGQAARKRQAALARAEGAEAVIEADWPNPVGPASAGRMDILDLLRAMARSVGPDGLARQGHAAATRLDSRPDLPRWTGPALVLHGAEDRPCPPCRGEEIAGLLPNARLRIVEGAGHFALLERPEALAEEIRTWSAAVYGS